METSRIPLAESDQNALTTPASQMISKLPRFLPGSKLRAPMIKRKLSPEPAMREESEKRARLNTSTSSNSSTSSSCSSSSYTAMNSRPTTRAAQKRADPGHRKPAPGLPKSSAGLRKPGIKPTSIATAPVKKGPANLGSSTRSLVNGTAEPKSRLGSASSVSALKKSNAAAPVKVAANGISKTGGAGTQGGGGGKKRPAWDLKGRLEDMESMMKRSNTNNDDMKMRIQMLESINQSLNGTIAQKDQQTSKTSQELVTIERQLRNCQADFENTRRQLETELDSTKRRLESELDTTKRMMTREIEDLRFQKSSVERQRDTLQADLTACQQEVAGLKFTVAKLTSSQAGLQAELTTTKLLLEQSVQDGHMKDAEIARLQGVLSEREGTIVECMAKLREHETVRRHLHNTIQELKGNIRVFCRVRPLLGEEVIGNDHSIHHFNFPDPEEQKILEMEKLSDANLNESSASRRGTNLSGCKYEFAFDRVFQPQSSQACVFEEISQLVQSALDGYNVCIFAYGQTGSGKTYTMEGGPNMTSEEEGMIPRAVDQIYRTAKELEERSWQYEFEASFLEIYNESIRDLLGCGKEDLKHDIKLVGPNSNEVMVTHMTTVKVTSPSQVHALLKKAKENRAVAETKCNERSSRSHSVFRLRISGQNHSTKETYIGNLNLIDLAGSERLKESGSQGARLKETQAINSSLANLGNVIMALANKDKHIPYRNSKLTYLLQNSLGGNSKTLMFVNISPREECFQETLCSLRFATKVNNCNIGTAQKKVTK